MVALPMNENVNELETGWECVAEAETVRVLVTDSELVAVAVTVGGDFDFVFERVSPTVSERPVNEAEAEIVREPSEMSFVGE
jgi:hypothetical protein